jgi:hypothetical protein
MLKRITKAMSCTNSASVAIAVPVEQAEASQARFDALMNSRFHNEGDPLRNVRPDSQGYKWPGHVVSQVEDLGNLGFVTRAYIGRS